MEPTPTQLNQLLTIWNEARPEDELTYSQVEGGPPPEEDESPLAQKKRSFWKWLWAVLAALAG